MATNGIWSNLCDLSDFIFLSLALWQLHWPLCCSWNTGTLHLCPWHWLFWKPETTPLPLSLCSVVTFVMSFILNCNPPTPSISTTPTDFFCCWWWCFEHNAYHLLTHGIIYMFSFSCFLFELSLPAQKVKPHKGKNLWWHFTGLDQWLNSYEKTLFLMINAMAIRAGLLITRQLVCVNDKHDNRG